MGVLEKLGSSLGLKQFTSSKANTKCNGGYAAGVQQPLVKPSDAIKEAQTATYLISGSATVITGSSMKPISELQPGEKILSIDVAAGGTFIWASVQHLEAMTEAPKPNTVALGLGDADDSVLISAEQVILTKDRKKRMTTQMVRRLQIGVDSAIVYNADGLQWRGKKAQETKKISSLRVSRDGESAVEYKLTVGSTNHALLVSCDQNAKSLLVINATNSTVDLTAVAHKKVADSEVKMEIKNTFIEMETPKEIDEQPRGIPRSYSDSDIRQLAVELDMEEVRTNGIPLFASDDLDLSSNATSRTRRTNSSTVSSILAQSEVSSISGGSIGQVRVGTQPVVAEDGHQTSTATREIKLSEYEQLPMNGNGMRLPAASSTHQPGRKSKCRKCAFYNTFSIKKGKICKNGALCDFCHDSHDRFIHRR